MGFEAMESIEELLLNLHGTSSHHWLRANLELE